MPPPSNSFFARWFALLSLLIVGLLVLGGWVRLTDSGLSIVQWDLISGVVPPLSDEGWQAKYDLYKDSPEFRTSTFATMTVSRFKYIFMMEYLHRLLARVIGLVSLLPLLVLWRRLKPGQRLQFGAVTGMITLNGVFGWLMVQSGLGESARVSHFMLTLHLTTALLTLALSFRQFLRYAQPHEPVWKDPVRRARMRPWTIVLCVVVLIQMMYGAMTAGLDAGHIAYDFPKMNGYWLMPGLLSGDGFFSDLVNHMPMIYFIHRVFGVAVGCYIAGFYLAWVYRVDCDNTRWGVSAVGVVCAVQVALGIAALALQLRPPMALAHQFTGCVLWLSCLYVLYCTRPLRAPSGEVASGG